MAKTKTTIVCWPACQLLMDQEGFLQNSALCSSEKMYEKYGDCSYAVSKEWLNSLDPEVTDKVFSLQETFEGPEAELNPNATEMQTI